jgi:MerR family transcriptional regulator, light-induced transcriptional regulator
MNAFTIKDLENLSGIRAHTIRIWEQRYNFLRPQRTETNIRYYNNDELRIILNVALLNKYGFKISHIDKMDQSELEDKILSLSQTQAQQERTINELIQFMVEMEVDKFEETVDKYIRGRGIEKTISHILFPFLEKIGILWSTNHINPAQEHLVTNIIRQKLIVGIESAVSHVDLKKVLLLFLPEGEHHELGLLFIYYLLKSRGAQVWYLGSNVPIKDVEYVAKVKSPDIVYTHLTSVASSFNLEKYLNNFQTRVPNKPLIVSGRITQSYKKKTPPYVMFKNSLSEVMEYIASL